MCSCPGRSYLAHWFTVCVMLRKFVHGEPALTMHKCIADLTGHSSSYPILGAIAQVFARPSFEIRFIPPGSIVVPGVSGQ